MKNILLWIKRMDNGEGDIVVKKKVLLKTGEVAMFQRVYDGDKDLSDVACDEIEDIEKADQVYYNKFRSN